MSKEIHIVFQVINFIHSPESKQYNLLQIDKLLLINLASHKGYKGICPSISTICKEMKIKRRQIIYRLKYLQSISLISILRTFGKSNQYDVILPCQTSALECTIYDKSSALQCTIPVQCSAPSSAIQCTQSTKEQLKKRERVATAPHTLHDSFKPTEDQKQHCLLNRIDIGSELVRFGLMSRAKGSKFEDWHAAFDLWLSNARKMTSVTGETIKEDVESMKRKNPPRYPEAKSAVKFFDEVVYDEVKQDPNDWRKQLIDERLKELNHEGTKFN